MTGRSPEHPGRARTVFAAAIAVVGSLVATAVFDWIALGVVFVGAGSDEPTYRETLLWAGAIGGAVSGVIAALSVLPLARRVGASRWKAVLAAWSAWTTLAVAIALLVPDSASVLASTTALVVGYALVSTAGVWFARRRHGVQQNRSIAIHDRQERP